MLNVRIDNSGTLAVLGDRLQRALKVPPPTFPATFCVQFGVAGLAGAGRAERPGDRWEYASEWAFIPSGLCPYFSRNLHLDKIGEGIRLP